jgi:hypothetical protein
MSDYDVFKMLRKRVKRHGVCTPWERSKRRSRRIPAFIADSVSGGTQHTSIMLISLTNKHRSRTKPLIVTTYYGRNDCLEGILTLGNGPFVIRCSTNTTSRLVEQSSLNLLEFRWYLANVLLLYLLLFLFCALSQYMVLHLP